MISSINSLLTGPTNMPYGLNTTINFIFDGGSMGKAGYNYIRNVGKVKYPGIARFKAG